MRLPIPTLAALGLAMATSCSRAQGIPVIDAANLVQTIQQVANDITQITNQVQQIQNQVQQIGQLAAQLKAATGGRHLGQVLDSPLLRNYVPASAYTLLNGVDASGYAQLTATAKALRNAGMVYNCLDLSGTARARCQALLAQPYQHKGLLQDAMQAASGRLAQIQGLMAQVNATTDQKGVLEIQARVSAESALLAHEISQVQMLQAMADSEERIARSRERERQYEMLTRTGKISDQLH